MHGKTCAQHCPEDGPNGQPGHQDCHREDRPKAIWRTGPKAIQDIKTAILRTGPMAIQVIKTAILRTAHKGHLPVNQVEILRAGRMAVQSTKTSGGRAQRPSNSPRQES